MAKNEYACFRCILRTAIGTETQAKFAAIADITPEHLNRMLNAPKINRPSKSTLKKIASVARNGITLRDLESALNKDDPDYHEETVC